MKENQIIYTGTLTVKSEPSKSTTVHVNTFFLFFSGSISVLFCCVRRERRLLKNLKNADIFIECIADVILQEKLNLLCKAMHYITRKQRCIKYMSSKQLHYLCLLSASSCSFRLLYFVRSRKRTENSKQNRKRKNKALHHTVI